jgi:acyl carrier protein
MPQAALRPLSRPVAPQHNGAQVVAPMPGLSTLVPASQPAAAAPQARVSTPAASVAPPAAALSVAPAPVVATTAPAAASAEAATAPPTASQPTSSPADVLKQLLAIVSERTGYPEDMVDADANIEADLGIDSIKRMEILTAFQQAHAGAQRGAFQGAMEKLTGIKTLRETAAVLAELLAGQTEVVVA